METLNFRLSAPTRAGGTRMQAIVGVVASGNLEVLLERASPADTCMIDITTAAHGFGAVWDAVVRDFVARRPAGGLRISINDGGMTRHGRAAPRARHPQDRGAGTMTVATANTVSLSWYEASARQRIEALVDAGSFAEFIGPEQREMSPHLAIFDLPEQFDDGIVIGRGRLDGSPVFVAAQEGRFMGGAFGEVHGAKLTGLLRAARTLKQDLLILFDTGGVRLQEANAGELAIAEIMRAIIEARRGGTNVIGLIGGRAGCYGGGSLIAGTCSRLIISEQGGSASAAPR